MLERFKAIALVAGVGFFFLAVGIQLVLPMLLKGTQTDEIVTFKGEKAYARPYTELEARGRKVYLREGCWYCHSQFVRPTINENAYYGPVSQEGEYAFDRPHTFGTRRIGPDLTREGGKRSDDWHIAHFYNPRYTVPQSLMPSFTWLFEGTELNVDGERVPKMNADGAALLAYMQRLGKDIGEWRNYNVPTGTELATPTAITSEPMNVRIAKGKVIFENKCSGCHGRMVIADKVADVEPDPNNKGRKLDAQYYLRDIDMYVSETKLKQLEVNIYKFDFSWFKQAIFMPNVENIYFKYRGMLPRPKEWWDTLQMKKNKSKGEFMVYLNGPADPFLKPKPRYFEQGIYKFRSTDASSLPLDWDIYRSLVKGLAGSSMPSWHDHTVGYKMTDVDKWYVIDYIKTFSPRYAKEKPGKKVIIPENEPARTRETEKMGRAVYIIQQCWQCHGGAGHADGSAADQYSFHASLDAWGGKLKIANYNNGIFKGGGDSWSLYRHLTAGIAGGPMPVYADANFMVITKSILSDEFLNSFATAVNNQGKSMFSKEDVELVKGFLEKLPTKKQFDSLPEYEKITRAQQYKWYLIHYIQSLAEKNSANTLHYNYDGMIGINPDYTNFNEREKLYRLYVRDREMEKKKKEEFLKSKGKKEAVKPKETEAPKKEEPKK